MPTRTQALARLTRLERKMADVERHAYYAQPVQLPTPSTDSARTILRTYITAGGLLRHPTTLAMLVMDKLGMSYAEIEALYARKETPSDESVPVAS